MVEAKEETKGTDKKWIIILVVAGVAFYLWQKGTLKGLFAGEAQALPSDTILAQARLDAMYAGMAPGQDEALARSAATRTPEQQSMADRVAIARWEARQQAEARGASAEEIRYAQTIAGVVVYTGKSTTQVQSEYQAALQRLAALLPSLYQLQAQQRQY